MIKAVIFDMDGVISDTQGLQSSVEELLLRNYGIKMSSHEITEKYAGISDVEFFGMIAKNNKIDTSPEVLIKEKWKELMKLAKTIFFRYVAQRSS